MSFGRSPSARVRLYWSRLVGLACDVFSVSQLFYGLLRKLFRKEFVLCTTADGQELYLAIEVMGDFVGILRLMTGQNKFGGGQGFPPSLTQALDVKIQGVARVA
jgi:hypothetical protein